MWKKTGVKSSCEAGGILSPGGQKKKNELGLPRGRFIEWEVCVRCAGVEEGTKRKGLGL